MQSSSPFRFVLGLVLVISLFGCSVRVGDLTMISSKSVDLEMVDLDAVPQVSGVSGKDTKFIFLFIPLGSPQLEQAIDEALRKGGGDLMTDVAIYQDFWWALLFGQTTIRVEGTVAKTRGVE